MSYLPLTYDEPQGEETEMPVVPVPGDGDLPYDGRRVALDWRPALYCSEQITRHGRLLADAHTLPWTLNVAEVRVSGRRVYEALNNLGRNKERPRFFVRIRRKPLIERRATQRPETAAPEGRLPLAVLCNRDEAELQVGWRLIRHFGGMLMATPEPDTAPPPIPDCSVLCLPLCKARDYAPAVTMLERGSKIVTSDAGLFEEFFAKRGRPGEWHVVHKWDFEHFREAVKDLLGLANEVTASAYVDDAPWIKPTGKESMPNPVLPVNSAWRGE